MTKAARYIVDTHCHPLTLYKGYKNEPRKWLWPVVEPYDNSAVTLYDMDCYRVDMAILLPSWIGTTNKLAAEIVKKHPDKFRSMAGDGDLNIKVVRGECKWTTEAALEEVENCLSGKAFGKDIFIGIGEFLPCNIDLKFQYTFRTRLDEIRKFAELAAKYDVVMDFHGNLHDRTIYPYVSKISGEFPDVPCIICHGGGHEKEGIQAATKCAASGNMAHGSGGNVYLETGAWPAEYFKIAIGNLNVGTTHLIWGHDYGNVPQYMVRNLRFDEPKQGPTFSGFLPPTPRYQTDFWGWSLHQIEKVKDWVTQDEINLILGGTAARIMKLPVPYPRLFPEGRPDLWGVHYEKYSPFIPPEQIQNPDTPSPYRW